LETNLNLIYDLFKKGAFLIDPEKAHNLSFMALSRYPLLLSELLSNDLNSDKYSLNVGTGTWSFPVGLAAGLDKNAEAVDFFTRLLFGAVEVGTVTPLAQEGNPKPRLFRYSEHESLRNCMGFNNKGAEVLKSALKNSNRNNKVIGINIGKNKVTPEEKAAEDYRVLFEQFHGMGDYIVINVSSPNTPGLRNLQSKEGLCKILDAIADLRKDSKADLYIKLSPDLNKADVDDAIAVANEYELTGLVATNTTIMPDKGVGGVSGRLLREKSTEFRSYILERITRDSSLELIGVGGVSEFRDLWRFWQDGGKVMQLYSSFIFGGPAVLNNMHKEIDRHLSLNDFSSLQEMIDNISKAKFYD
jgi:dihydroorotate dehydrogenase